MCIFFAPLEKFAFVGQECLNLKIQPEALKLVSICLAWDSRVMSEPQANRAKKPVPFRKCSAKGWMLCFYQNQDT